MGYRLRWPKKNLTHCPGWVDHYKQIFKVYVSRVFSLVVLPGKRIALENYDYLTRFRLLSLLADELRAQSEPQAARRLSTFYALQVLDGKRQQRARLLFALPVVEVA
ncbi:hypothetical protein ACM7EO_21180 [Pseudomonas aeruginosa]|uniref:hypothetical protein n=1 Tax=Pseudomonas aeruginosa TaxID=287 RepID=UPI000FFEFD67|nr:hypothetical protein [Pseudomonas aeruginosa]